MARIYLSIFVLFMTLCYIAFNVRKLKPNEEYHYHKFYAIGKTIVSCGWSGSGSYVDVRLFDTNKIDDLKKAIDSSDYKWQELNAIKIKDQTALESFPEGAVIVGDFNFDGKYEIATSYMEAIFEKSVSTPVYLDPNGEVLEIRSVVVDCILLIISFLQNIFVSLAYGLSIIAMAILWIAYGLKRAL